MNKKIWIISFLLLSFLSTGIAQKKVGIFDLSYTLETDLTTTKGVNTAWDDAHTISSLQGMSQMQANATLMQAYIALKKR